MESRSEIDLCLEVTIGFVERHEFSRQAAYCRYRGGARDDKAVYKGRITVRNHLIGSGPGSGDESGENAGTGNYCCDVPR